MLRSCPSDLLVNCVTSHEGDRYLYYQSASGGLATDYHSDEAIERHLSTDLSNKESGRAS